MPTPKPTDPTIAVTIPAETIGPWDALALRYSKKKGWHYKVIRQTQEQAAAALEDELKGTKR